MKYLVAFFLLFSTALQASCGGGNCGCGGYNCCGQNFNFYIGAVGGLTHPGNSYRFTDNVANDARVTFGGITGIGGGVFGVQTYCCNWLLAWQFNVLGNSHNKTLVNAKINGVGPFKTELKNNFQWGGDLRIGYRLCGATPYVLGGFEGGRWELKLQNLLPEPALGVAAGATQHVKKFLYGGKVGGGVMFPFFSNCLVGNVEYSYTWFGKHKKTLTDPTGASTGTHKTNIQQGMFLVGLNWLF